MPIQPHHVTIGDYDFEIHTLPFKKGRKLIRLALMVAGKVLAAIEGSGLVREGGTLSLASIELSDVGGAILGILDVLTDEEIDALSALLAPHTSFKRVTEQQPRYMPLDAPSAVDGGISSFDEVFAGNMASWGLWVWHNVRLNGGNFLPMLAKAGLVPVGDTQAG